MKPKRSLSLLLAGLLLVTFNVDIVPAQQDRVDGAAIVEQILGQIDRDLPRIDDQIRQNRQYLNQSFTKLRDMQGKLEAYERMYNDYKARRDAAEARGQADEVDRIANEWNNTHRPRSRALGEAAVKQAQNLQLVERRVIELNARRLELASQRNRIQLGRSRIMQRLEELGGSEPGRKRIFDATRGFGKRVQLGGVPDVGPSGPVTPPPGRDRR